PEPSPADAQEGEGQKLQQERRPGRDPVDREHEAGGQLQCRAELGDRVHPVEGMRAERIRGARLDDALPAHSRTSASASASTKARSWVAATTAPPASTNLARIASCSAQVQESCP